jgi:hypothetical protein
MTIRHHLVRRHLSDAIWDKIEFGMPLRYEAMQVTLQ